MNRFFYIILVLILSACESLLDFTVEGNGILENTNKYIENKFNEVSLLEDFNLEIYNHSKDSLSITAESNFLPFINFIFKDEKLIIKTRDSKVFIPNYDIKIELFLNEISLIENLGNGKIISDSLVTTKLEILQNKKGTIDITNSDIEEVYITQENNNLLNIDGEFNEINVLQIGSGELKIKGKTINSKIIQKGSGEINSYGMRTTKMSVEQYGNGLVYCYIDSLFDVKINGGGRVIYKGNPEIISDLSEDYYLVKDNS